MTDDRDHHATIFVPPDVARPVEAARREWDPVMAAQIAAHVTVVHPRTSRRGRDFWDRGRCRTPDEEFTPTELAITAFDGARWVVRMTFPLERPLTVATERRSNP